MERSADLPGFVDTNTIVRYLVRDDVNQAQRAAGLIEGDQPLRVSIVIIAEVAYVLSTLYGVARIDVVDAICTLLDRENIEVHEIKTGLAIQGLQYCRPSR